MVFFDLMQDNCGIVPATQRINGHDLVLSRTRLEAIPSLWILSLIYHLMVFLFVSCIFSKMAFHYILGWIIWPANSQLFLDFNHYTIWGHNHRIAWLQSRHGVPLLHESYHRCRLSANLHPMYVFEIHRYDRFHFDSIFGWWHYLLRFTMFIAPDSIVVYSFCQINTSMVVSHNNCHLHPQL